MRSGTFLSLKFLIAALLITAAQNLASYAESPTSPETPTSPELKALLNRVDMLSRRNDYEAAIPIANAAVAKFPNDYAAHVKRGLVNLYLEEEEKAITDFQWALKQKTR